MQNHAHSELSQRGSHSQIMCKGRKRKVEKPGPPSKALPAQGKGQQKRTPTSAFDPAAGADIYEPELIVGERQKNLGSGKQETQYEVKWKGYDSKQNTWVDC